MSKANIETLPLGDNVVLPKRRGRPPKIAPDAKKLLSDASVEAARLLIMVMLNEDNPLNVRLDCANKIMDRALGKAGAAVADAEANVVELRLAEELREFAK